MDLTNVLDIICSADGDYHDDIDAHISAGHDGHRATIAIQYEDGPTDVFHVVVECAPS